ncbi:MAG: hypothetical protein HYV01_02430 [Deltaproteobacteria bacterium]|nr:hypothetical protein [Deltaproteobacteria bacterium]
MKAIKNISIVLVVALVFVGFLFLPVRAWFMEFESYVRSLGAIGPVLVVLVYVLCTLLFIPGSAITIGSGTLFGLQTGFVVVVLGANLGALCAFLLALAPSIRPSASRVSRWFCSRD